MADEILKIGAEFDVSGIVSGAQQATVAMDQLGTKVGEASAEMLNELYPTEQAVTEATEEVAASTGRMTSAMGAARVEMGALEGSAGMMAGGLARVAAQSETIAPLIQAAFVPFAVAAFADIIFVAGEKLYNLYQNLVNSKDELAAFAAIEKSVAEQTAEFAKQTEAAYIALLKLEDPLEADREKIRSLSTETLHIKVDDKKLKELPDDMAKFLATMESFPANELDDRFRRVAGSIEYLQQKLSAPVLRGTFSKEELQAQVSELQQYEKASRTIAAKARIAATRGRGRTRKGRRGAIQKDAGSSRRCLQKRSGTSRTIHPPP